MKEFEVPKFEVVHFVENDIIVTSNKCVPCDGCPPENHHCSCVDFN